MAENLIPLSVAQTVPRYSLAGSVVEGLAAALAAYMRTRQAVQQQRSADAIAQAEGRREDAKAEAYIENQKALADKYRYDVSEASRAQQQKVDELNATIDHMKRLNEIRAAEGSLAAQEKDARYARLQAQAEQLRNEIDDLQDFIRGGPEGVGIRTTGQRGLGGGGSRGGARGGAGSTKESSTLDDLSKTLFDLIAAREQASASGDAEGAASYQRGAEHLAALIPYAGGDFGLTEFQQAQMEAEGYRPYQINLFMRSKFGMMDPTEEEAAAAMLEQENDPAGNRVATYLRRNHLAPSPAQKKKNAGPVTYGPSRVGEAGQTLKRGTQFKGAPPITISGPSAISRYLFEPQPQQ